MDIEDPLFIAALTMGVSALALVILLLDSVVKIGR